MENRFKNFIGLITDFGQKGSHYVASIKGVILSINPKAKILDISHEISPFSILEASYMIRATINYLPKNSIIVIVVDPGVGSRREILGLKTDSNHLFIGPNNGIFGFVSDFINISKCVKLNKKKYWIKPTSKTFHGRDIMAPIAAYLSLDKPLTEFGEEFPLTKLKLIENIHKATIEDDEIQCYIQYVDNFGNAITNFLVEEQKDTNFLQENTELCIIYNHKKYDCHYTTHFGKFPVGTLLLIKGSTGFLEISINQGNAQELIGFFSGDRIKIIK